MSTESRRLSRRELLGGLLGTSALALLAACGPAAPTPAPTSPAAAAAKPTTAAAAPTQAAAPPAQPTTAPAQAAPAAAGGGKEFHGAWPYEVPPAGHWN